MLEKVLDDIICEEQAFKSSFPISERLFRLLLESVRPGTLDEG
jgi:hypothetical protein